ADLIERRQRSEFQFSAVGLGPRTDYEVDILTTFTKLNYEAYTYPR
uniref:Unknown protein from spots 23/28/205 of 2D-PAGE of thylakoid (Fragments) n=1 Tax=Pisum sativum TaxID=3888 RepID=UT023_PEA|nr:RecName: Full=Unknown protein from spots 23/28/205 of 2D-PAGE of thylakoid [Pisum sativum]